MYRDALYAPAPGPSQTNGGVYVVCFVALYMVIYIIAPRITHTHTTRKVTKVSSYNPEISSGSSSELAERNPHPTPATVWDLC
jgi:hypothetical protein